MFIVATNSALKNFIEFLFITGNSSPRSYQAFRFVCFTVNTASSIKKMLLYLAHNYCTCGTSLSYCFLPDFYFEFMVNFSLTTLEITCYC